MKRSDVARVTGVQTAQASIDALVAAWASQVSPREFYVVLDIATRKLEGGPSAGRGGCEAVGGMSTVIDAASGYVVTGFRVLTREVLA